MDSQMMIEMVGYLGSALVLVSFLMTSVWKLRVVNTIGSVIFMTYALIIHSYPTAIMNFCLVLINLRFLWKMRHTGKEYDLVQLEDTDLYLQYLLKRQGEDIKTLFPGIKLTPHEDLEDVNRAYLITCGGAPAGITLGKQEGDTLSLVLDYSLPEYRDFSLGAYLFNQLKHKGVKKVIYNGPTENHMPYLNKMEFVKVNEVYEKNL